MRIADADGLIKHFENVVDVKLFTPAQIITIIDTFSSEVDENDLISRKEMLEKFRSDCCGECDSCPRQTEAFSCELLEEAPAVFENEALTSRWIASSSGFLRCENCRAEFVYSYVANNSPDYPKYCPECGIKMRIGGAEP